MDDKLREELSNWHLEKWLRGCAAVGGAIALGVWQRSLAAAFFGLPLLIGLFELVIYLGALGIVLGRIDELVRDIRDQRSRP